MTRQLAEVPIKDYFGFGDIQTLGESTSKLVPAVFSVAASLVVLYFLWGAYKYIASGGNKEEIEAGRKMITHSIIGFLILMFTFLVLQFLTNRLFGLGFNIFG